MWDEHKRLWVAKLINGNYLISVRAQGYLELNENIDVDFGSREFKFVMKPSNKVSIDLKVQAINIENGKPLKNVFFELWKESSQLAEEGLSNDNGEFEYSLKTIGIH